MIKKMLLISVIAAVALCAAAPAFASVSSNFADIFMTDSSGSNAPKTTFSWTETPWLYVKLTSSALNFTSSWWFNPEGDSKSFVRYVGADNEWWLSPANWNSMKAAGTWKVNSSAFFFNGNENVGSARFTVTPEPVSSALFLLGGVALAGVKFYRSKKK